MSILFTVFVTFKHITIYKCIKHPFDKLHFTKKIDGLAATDAATVHRQRPKK